MGDIGKLFGELFKAMQEAERKYIPSCDVKFPIEINGIKVSHQFVKQSMSKTGSLVKIRPCGEEYKNKTFLGILLGDIATENVWRLNKDTNEIEVIPITNPAIFVPELKKIVFGCESWWGVINTEEELKQISDADIENVWYVQLLKSMLADKKTD